MKNSTKKLLAALLLMCMMVSCIVPAAYAAETQVTYNFDQFSNYNKLPEDEASGQPNMVAKTLTGDLGSSTCQKTIPDRFAAGDLNWTYESASSGMCGTTTETEHLPGSNARFYKSWGIRGVFSQGAWIAYRIKSPGDGEFAVDLSFYQYSGSGMVSVYILEAQGEASIDHDTVLARREYIQNAMDPDNRIGMAALYECTTTGVNSVYLGKCTLEADKEYIVVYENYQKAPIAGNSYISLNSLTFIAGESANQTLEAQDHIRPILVSQNTITTSDNGSMGALYELNGRDYFFLPLEGGKMAIYDLDGWELVDLVSSGLYYPTSATTTEDGKVIVGGDGRKMFIFDTATMTGKITPDFRSVDTLSDEGHIQGVHAGADGKIYFGTLYGGHMVQYDMDAKTFVDLGDMVCQEIQEMAGVIAEGDTESAEDSGGVRTVYYLDGYLYGWADSDSYDIIVKYDIDQGTVVGAVDVSSQLSNISTMRGMSVLGDKYLIVGASGASGMVLIDLSTFTLVTYKNATAKGIIAASSKAEDLWETGMSGHATEVIDGKQYFESSKVGMFCYDISTGTLSRVGSGGYGFRTGSRTLVTLDRDGDGTEEPYLFSYGGTPTNPRLFNFSSFSKISATGLFQTQYEGAGGSDLNIGTTYDDVLYIGAWNNWNCVAFDTKTETITSRYITGGQTDSQTYYVDSDGNFHLVSGNYSACVVYEIDPVNKTGYNGDADSNIIKPLISNMRGYQQKRIHTVAAGDGYVFAGTIPESYVFGGGIGVYDTETGTEDFIRFKETSVKGEKIIDAEFSELWDLSVNGIAYSNGLLYGCTTTEGGSGAGTKSGQSAMIFVFDYKNMEIEAVLDLREYIPDYLPQKNGEILDISYIGGITADDEGRLWSAVSDVLFCFTYDQTLKTFTVQVIQDMAHSKYTTSSSMARANRKVAFDPENNSVYMSFFASNMGTYHIQLEDWDAPVGQLVVTDCTQIMDAKPKTFAIGANNNLYYVSGTSLYMLPINVTDSDWTKAKEVDAQIAALGDITLASAEAVAAAREAYDGLSLRDKALVQKNYILQEAEAELLELQIEAASDKVSANSVDTLTVLLGTYNDLSSRLQGYVKNYETLLTICDLAVMLSQDTDANTVQEQIFALEVTSRRDEAAVVAAREAYEALPEDSKALVNTKYLTAAEEKLVEIKNTTSAQYIYDFKLYDNSDFMNSTVESSTETISEAFNGADNNLYSAKVTVGTKKMSVYNWFFKAYSDTINWAPEAFKGASADKNLFKDATVTAGSKKGLKISLSSTGSGWGAIRICVPEAGVYQMTASFFYSVTNLDVYILTTETGYTSVSDRETVSTIPALLEENTPVGQITSKGLTHTVAETWTCEAAGDYIVVFRQTSANTSSIYLDTLVLTELVSAEEAIAEVNGQYFLTLEDAFAYQTANGEEAVKLSCDVVEADLVLPDSAVLDLNGYTLNVLSVDASAPGAQIVDSTDGGAKLCVDEELLLNQDNGQLPLLDEEENAYSFYNVEVIPVAVTGKTGTPKYWFQVKFSNKAACELIDTATDMRIQAYLTWEDQQTPVVAYADAAFSAAWASKYSANDNIYITVTAVDAGEITDFTLIPQVAAYGVVISGDSMQKDT